MSQLWITALVTLGAALLLSLVAAAVAVAVRPGVLLLTSHCVCSSGAKLVVDPKGASRRQTGGHRLVATCEGDPQPVTSRAFVWLWVLFFAVALPVGALLAAATCACL